MNGLSSAASPGLLATISLGSSIELPDESSHAFAPLHHVHDRTGIDSSGSGIVAAPEYAGSGTQRGVLVSANTPLQYGNFIDNVSDPSEIDQSNDAYLITYTSSGNNSMLQQWRVISKLKSIKRRMQRDNALRYANGAAEPLNAILRAVAAIESGVEAKRDAILFASNLPARIREPQISVDDGIVVFEWKWAENDRHAIVSLEGDGYVAYAYKEEGRYVPGSVENARTNRIPADLLGYVYSK
jgi:hypothetical protein